MDARGTAPIMQSLQNVSLIRSGDRAVMPSILLDPETLETTMTKKEVAQLAKALAYALTALLIWSAAIWGLLILTGIL